MTRIIRYEQVGILFLLVILFLLGCNSEESANPVSIQLTYGFKDVTDNAPWVARNGHGTVTFNNLLWVFGGYDNTNYLHDVWYSRDGLNWIQVANAPWSVRNDFSFCVFQNRLWVMGGVTTGFTPVQDIWSTSDGVQWTLVKSNPAWGPRFSASLLAFNGKMYLIGGENNAGQSLGEVWSSSDGITWTQVLTQFTTPWGLKAGLGACVFNNEMWVMGGDNGLTGGTNDVWVSTDGANWVKKTGAASWTPRFAMAVNVFKGKIWLVGGSVNAVGVTSDIWYTQDGINWTEAAVSAPWTGRYKTQLTTYMDKMWLMGGSNQSAILKNDVWYSDFSSDFTATITTGSYPFKAKFNMVVGTGNVFGTKFLWDFGDNKSSTEQEPEHIYQNPGLYTVGVTVFDQQLSSYITIKPNFIHVYDYDYTI